MDVVTVYMDNVVYVGSQVREALLEMEILLYHFFQGEIFLTCLLWIKYLIFPAASDDRSYPSPSDIDPDADDDGYFQGTIQLPPPHNYADRGTIRE